MLKLFGRIARDFLWDESKFQRYLAAALFAVGALLVNGGAIPGTTIVLADLSGWSGWGAGMQWAAVFIGAGVKTPGGAVTREAAEAMRIVSPKP